MLRLHPTTTNDPLAGMGWRDRWAWRRTERAVLSNHHAELAASLRGLLASPVREIATGQAGTVSVTLPGWKVGVADVGAAAGAALLSLARQPCHLAGAGRYGPFWWLAVASDSAHPESRVVVLGTEVRLRPVDGGGDGPPSTGLTPQGTRKEYSLP